MCALCEQFGAAIGEQLHAAASGTGGSASGPVAASTGGVTATGNADIDGVLAGVRWSGAITYSFTDSSSDYGSFYGSGEPTASGFAQISAQQQQVVHTTMGLVQAYTNLAITFAGTGDADIQIAQSSKANPTAYAYYPSFSETGGDVWFGTAYNFRDPKVGDYYYAAHIHEIGHALGLKHSQETGGVANVAVPSGHDGMEYSIMSYRSYIGGPTTGYTNEQFGYATTFMMNDIAALQTLYGADYTTQSGDTVYSWSETSGRQFINGAGQLTPGGNRVFMTVWDGGGTDTYDFSNYAGGTVIDLSPGGYSTTASAQKAYLGGGNYAHGNVYNAYLFGNDARSYIENAIGGSGGDQISGNAIANKLEGRGGADTIAGQGGADTLIGGGGGDTLTGGAGGDVFSFASGDGADTITDFSASAGDRIDLSAFTSLTAFADVLARASQVGANTLIDLGFGDSITLANVSRSSLGAGAFALFGSPTVTTNTAPTGINLSATTVSEAVNPKAVVGDLSAVDSDENETFTYKLISNPGSKFAISGNSLVVLGTLNYETQRTYSVKVRVTDATKKTFDKTFVIGIENAAPTTPVDAYTKADAVLEGAVTGTLTGIRASALDPHGGTVTYSLTDDAGGRFAINASTGYVSVKNGKLIDYETATEHTITVRASDRLLTSEQTFVIAVTDRPGEAISGTAANNVINGARTVAGQGVASNEDDRIAGMGGFDRLSGLAGDDRIDGGRGVDHMKGGGGNDRYSVDRSGDVVAEASHGGIDSVFATCSFRLPHHVENLRLLGPGDISATGNDLDNLIIGNRQDNQIDGLGGNDVLRGGAGDDTLTGGAGADRMSGGRGADTFVFAALDGALDAISDFRSGLDHLALSVSGFGGGLVTGGSIALVLADDLASASSIDGTGYLIEDVSGEGRGMVYFDPTGGAADDAVAFLRLAPGVQLAAGDITLLA